jgi:hypothetical protein
VNTTANARSPEWPDVLQQRLQALQTEQQADLTRVQVLETERQQLVETCLRRAGAISELDALCQPIVATRVVQTMQTFGNRSMGKFIRQAMRTDQFSLYTYLPVAFTRYASGPYPTGFRLVHTRPKTSFNSQKRRALMMPGNPPSSRFTYVLATAGTQDILMLSHNICTSYAAWSGQSLGGVSALPGLVCVDG